MDTADPAKLADYLHRCVALLSEFSWIFRESNTKFVELNVLDHIPRTWIDAVQVLTNEEINQIPTGLMKEEFPEDLNRLLRGIKELRWDHKKLSNSGSEQMLKPLKGMSAKKSHEIVRLADTVIEHCGKVDVLVDLGCGLGYLSEYLRERHPFKILGLECDSQRVESAIKRQEKFYATSTNHVMYRHHLITESSMDFIKEQIRIEFNLERPKIGLIGLHACGDLTVDALKLAANEPLVQGLVIMPCCYHRMALVTETTFRSFPLSASLRRIMEDVTDVTTTRSPTCAPLGSAASRTLSSLPIFHRPFLRLACQQSVKHWQRMSEVEHLMHGHRMYTRSLAGALVTAAGASSATSPLLAYATAQKEAAPCGEEPLIRRISKFNACPSSSISFDGLCTEFGLFTHDDRPIPWTEEHLRQFMSYSEKYTNGGFLAEILTGLQTAIQEICENVVLLDKVQFVHELSGCGGEGLDCHISKITNDELSPRCFALVLRKGERRSFF